MFNCFRFDSSLITYHFSLITYHLSLITSEALLRALASSAPCGGPFRSVLVACERRARHFWIALQRYNIFRNIPNFCHRFDVILTSKLLKFGRIDASIILHSHNRNIEGDFQHEFSRFFWQARLERMFNSYWNGWHLPWQCDFVTLWH